MARSPARTRFLLALLLLVLAAALYGVPRLRIAGWAPVGTRGPAVEGAGQAGESAEIFFSSVDGRALVPERRALPRSEGTVGRCRAIIQELKKGPMEGGAALLPVELEIRSLFIVDGALVIDLDAGIRGASAGLLQEILIWYSIADSIIMNVKEIGAVYFLVDGREADTVLGHMDMRGAFSERLDLVRWR